MVWRALLAAAVAAQPVTIPVTGVYDGPPPFRFMQPREVDVSLGTLAQCGDPGPGLVFEGCVRGTTVHMPNPCDFRNEHFALILCHEMAHRNGWPRLHGP